MVDPRHYNAWYGLGMLYLHQEKFEFSEHHFRMAFRINPKSSVILSYLGTALHFLKVNLLLHLMCFLQTTTTVVVYLCFCIQDFETMLFYDFSEKRGRFGRDGESYFSR